MTVSRRAGAGLIVLVLAAALAPAGAVPPPPRSVTVSLAWDGQEGDGDSGGQVKGPALSADGQVVAFESSASNLVPGEDNGVADVYVRDLRTGTIERVSVSSTGKLGAAPSGRPSISADGRFVVFSGRARLVPEIEEQPIVFFDAVWLHDRQEGTTELVSRTADGAPANGVSGPGVISADGNVVAFVSRARNLLGDAEGNQVFTRDRGTGEVELVSRSIDGTPGNDNASTPGLSADGRYVVFGSRADNLVDGDTNDEWDVFVHDRDTGETTLESVNDYGEQGNARNNQPVMTPDARFIAFQSMSTNLIPNDTNYLADVYLRDRERGTTERVSVSSAGRESPNANLSPAISADGRFVTFVGYHGALAPGGFNVFGDVYVHDRHTRRTERMRADDGAHFNAMNRSPDLSADARYVGLATKATNLGHGATNDAYDIFLLDRGPALGPWGPSSITTAAGELRASGEARFSGAVLGSAQRPASGDTLLGQDTGEELTGLSIALRPDEQDLLFRVGTADLPRFEDPYGEVGAGIPGILYGLAFTVDGVRYEMRVQPIPTRLVEWVDAALFRCETVCTEIWRGDRRDVGFGTTGQELVLPVPLDLVDATEGSLVADVRAFTGVGTADTGALAERDAITVDDVGIPAPTVSAALTSSDRQQAEVVFDVEGSATTDSYIVHVPTDGMPPGEATLWLRFCQGACSVTQIPVTVP